MAYNLAQDLSYILKQGTTVSTPSSPYQIGVIKKIESKNMYKVILPQNNNPVTCSGQDGSSYNIGDSVYVLGNGTLIIGKVAVTNSISGFKKAEQEMSKTQKILKIENSQYNEILSNDIKFNNIRDIGVEPYNAFWIKARFTVDIPEQELEVLKSGDYGLLVTITTRTGKYYVYRFSSKDNMYSDSLLYNESRQEAIFSLNNLDSRIENIRIQGYVNLNSFVNYDGTTNTNIKTSYFKMANLAFYLGYSVNSLKNSAKLILQSNDNKNYYKEESSDDKALVDYNDYTDLYKNSAVRGMYLSYSYYDIDTNECKVISLTEKQIENFSNTSNIRINSNNEIRWYRYNPDRKEEEQDRYGGKGWILLGKKKKNGKLVKDDDGYYVLNAKEQGKKIGRHLRLLNKKKKTKFKVIWFSSTGQTVSNILSFTRNEKVVKEEKLKTFNFRRDGIQENSTVQEISLDIRETSFPEFINTTPIYDKVTSYNYQGNYGFYYDNKNMGNNLLIKIKPDLSSLDEKIDKIEWIIPANSMIKLKNEQGEFYDNIYNNSLWGKEMKPMMENGKDNQVLEKDYYRYTIEEIRENDQIVSYKLIKFLTKYKLDGTFLNIDSTPFEVLNFEEDNSLMLSINSKFSEESTERIENIIKCSLYTVTWPSQNSKFIESKTQKGYSQQIFVFSKTDNYVENDIFDSVEQKNIKFGLEDEERKFTGVVLGVYDQNNATEQVNSIIGYKNDIETFNIDCTSGIFTIGPKDRQQIILNGNTGEILINNQNLLELISERKEN